MDLLHLFICNIIVGQVTIELESLNEHREPELEIWFGRVLRAEVFVHGFLNLL